MLTAKKTIGNFGERLACDFLIKRGYQIIDTNKKVGRREIDIVAVTGNLTIFIEVKTLSTAQLTPAEEALTRRQIEILKKAIQIYCWVNKINPFACRLDFICINMNRHAKTAKIKHYANIS
jgi:putative endonuclease